MPIRRAELVRLIDRRPLLVERHGTRELTEAGLSRDVVYSIDGAPGELWIGRQRGGLTHLRYDGRS